MQSPLPYPQAQSGLFLGDKTIHHPELASGAPSLPHGPAAQRFPKGRWAQAPNTAMPEPSFFWSALNEY